MCFGKFLLMASLILSFPITIIAQHWSEPVLVDSINGVIDDFYPSISADGQTMYFTTGNRIMVTHRSGDTWSAPTMLGPNINSGQRQVKATVTPDNRTLYFTSWRAGGYGTYDIWKSNWDDGSNSWGEPEVLPEPINTAYMEWDVQLSLDGMYMYFASDRRYGWGFNDIWCSEWNSQSESWAEPYNLGNVVNSSSIDECPYPTSDPNILYFSSLHSHGFDEWQGGTDIFVAYKRNGVWDSLSILPPPINTIHNEGSLAISYDETELYIASTRLGGPAEEDIFKSELITSIQEDDETRQGYINNFYLYPNPARERVLFTYNTGAKEIPVIVSVYNILGQQLYSTKFNKGGDIRWNLSTADNNTFPNGVYFAVSKMGDQIIKKKFTIVK